MFTFVSALALEASTLLFSPKLNRGTVKVHATSFTLKAIMNLRFQFSRSVKSLKSKMKFYISATIFLSIFVFLPICNRCLLLDSSLPETTNFFSIENSPVKTVPQLIKSWGYEVEEHFVTTDDGYTLALHRIPPKGMRTASGKIPILLGHCLVGTSATWTFGPPSNSLAYILSDLGFDVWMSNVRGNTYSKNHTIYDSCTSCKDFWQFSFDESAIFDYPAIIDHILNKTGHDDLFFIGYSMATTQYLILLSELPQYNSKIRAGFLLGPTAFGGNATNPLLVIGSHAEAIQSLLNTFGIYEFLPNMIETKVWLHLCQSGSVYEKICGDIFSLATGTRPEKLNASMAAIYMSQTPGGTSTKTFVHYAQLFRNGGRFMKYDYGPSENVARYGSTNPPEYNLEKITALTFLYSGDADGFATPLDVAVLSSRLTGSQVKTHHIAKKDWSHIDFVFSKDAAIYVYQPILQELQSLIV